MTDGICALRHMWIVKKCRDGDGGRSGGGKTSALRGGGGVPEHVRFSGRRKGTSEKGEHALKENNTL